jgi:hypothetical protein
LSTGISNASRPTSCFAFPLEDAVLADYGLDTLEAAATALCGRSRLFEPARPIAVDILRNSSDLATMTTLSEDEIERTGTVAVSKWSRIMLTSPRAMRLGYEWQDSLSHEFVHYVVAALDLRPRAGVAARGLGEVSRASVARAGRTFAEPVHAALPGQGTGERQVDYLRCHAPVDGEAAAGRGCDAWPSPR